MKIYESNYSAHDVRVRVFITVVFSEIFFLVIIYEHDITDTLLLILLLLTYGVSVRLY